MKRLSRVDKLFNLKPVIKADCWTPKPTTTLCPCCGTPMSAIQHSYHGSHGVLVCYSCNQTWYPDALIPQRRMTKSGVRLLDYESDVV